MIIGVISDTHIPVRAKFLPPKVFEVFAGVDLILHAGDLITLDVLDELGAIAPVHAVYGNVDPPEVTGRLPATRIIETGKFRIGLVHGHEGKGRTTPDRAAGAVPGADAVVFGHSHKPMNEWTDGKLLFNPGSATDRRGMAPYCSVGLLEVGDKLVGRIVPLDSTKA